MENGRFEDVSPIKNGDIPASYVSLPEGSFLHLHRADFSGCFHRLANVKKKLFVCLNDCIKVRNLQCGQFGPNKKQLPGPRGH